MHRAFSIAMWLFMYLRRFVFHLVIPLVYHSSIFVVAHVCSNPIISITFPSPIFRLSLLVARGASFRVSFGRAGRAPGPLPPSFVTRTPVLLQRAPWFCAVSSDSFVLIFKCVFIIFQVLKEKNGTKEVEKTENKLGKKNNKASVISLGSCYTCLYFHKGILGSLILCLSGLSTFGALVKANKPPHNSGKPKAASEWKISQKVDKHSCQNLSWFGRLCWSGGDWGVTNSIIFFL